MTGEGIVKEIEKEINGKSVSVSVSISEGEEELLMLLREGPKTKAEVEKHFALVPGDKLRRLLKQLESSDLITEAIISNEGQKRLGYKITETGKKFLMRPYIEKPASWKQVKEGK